MNDTNEAREMPKYDCHKQVWALNIAKILFNLDEGTAVITPREEGYAAFEVSREYIRKHNPRAGGYYVAYKDGYKSFSPAEAFEAGYSPIS